MTLTNKIITDITNTFDRISIAKKVDLEFEFKHLQFIQLMLYHLIFVYKEEVNEVFLINFVKQFERLDDSDVKDFLYKSVKNNQMINILIGD